MALKWRLSAALLMIEGDTRWLRSSKSWIHQCFTYASTTSSVVTVITLACLARGRTTQVHGLTALLGHGGVHVCCKPWSALHFEGALQTVMVNFNHKGGIPNADDTMPAKTQRVIGETNNAVRLFDCMLSKGKRLIYGLPAGLGWTGRGRSECP